MSVWMVSILGVTCEPQQLSIGLGIHWASLQAQTGCVPLVLFFCFLFLFLINILSLTIVIFLDYR